MGILEGGFIAWSFDLCFAPVEVTWGMNHPPSNRTEMNTDRFSLVVRLPEPNLTVTLTVALAYPEVIPRNSLLSQLCRCNGFPVMIRDRAEC